MWLDHEKILRPLGGEANTVTVSGFSGGGSVTNNFYMVFSDYVQGAAMIASGPYGINLNTEGKLTQSEAAQKAIELANENAAAGLIAPTSNVNGAPIYIFSAPDDATNNPKF